jgi:hypothetical protein
MKVESNLAWSTTPVPLTATATKRTVAIEIREGITNTITIKLTPHDAQRLADAILTSLKGAIGDDVVLRSL